MENLTKSKIALGIITLIWSIILFFKSILGTATSALTLNLGGGMDSIRGILMALFMLVSGIIMLVAAKQAALTADICDAVLLCIAFLIGFGSLSGTYCLILALVFLIWHIQLNKKNGVPNVINSTVVGSTVVDDSANGTDAASADSSASTDSSASADSATAQPKDGKSE